MNMHLPQALACVAASLLLAACASQPRYQDSRYGDQRPYNSRYDSGRYVDQGRVDTRYRDARCSMCGRVEYIGEVWIDERSSHGGAILGAIIGGAIGNQVGSGDGRRAATVAGAVVGGVIGNEADRDRRDGRRALRIELRMDDGRTAVVTQLEDPRLNVGDRAVIRDRQVYAMH